MAPGERAPLPEEPQVVKDPPESDVRSALLIPLRPRGRPLAALYAFSRELDDCFGEDELRVAGFVASLAGGALENAELVSTLAERETRLAALFSSVAVGIAVVDAAGRIQEANQALVRMLGEECRQTAFADFVYGPDRPELLSLLEELVAGRRSHFQLELRHLGSRGNILWGEVSASALSQEAGLAVVTLSDVSVRRLEQIATFQETERRLLAAEVHDVISQPLAGLGYRLETVAQTEASDYRAEVARAARQTRDILDELRNLGGSGLSRPRWDLGDVVQIGSACLGWGTCEKNCARRPATAP
ncbi:MAG: PAS domain-containing protein [Armatimonadetes bacterium]|nr:PAS domain-containing protein [Armatimonadota bacterium]